MSKDYAPYKDREEHDFINKVTVELALINLSVTRLRNIVNNHIQTSITKIRKDDRKEP